MTTMRTRLSQCLILKSHRSSWPQHQSQTRFGLVHTLILRIILNDDHKI